jgi:2-hydroxy-3-oxopropionate reductase
VSNAGVARQTTRETPIIPKFAAFAGRIGALGCDYLDAPVSGGEVGGEAAFVRLKPVFEPLGKNITLVGANGDGQTAKVAN